MKYEYMHPREQIVTIMRRVYGYGMTTTSGGNISILDESGDIWITPGGIDKGGLSEGDIVRMRGDTVVAKISGTLNMPPDQIFGFLAKHLPTIIDALSPNGQLQQPAPHA